MCKDIFAFEEFIKAVGAGDKKGLEDLEARKKLAWLDPMSRVLILEEKTNQFIGKGVPVSEARILNGPYAGQSVWVPNSYLVVLKAQMVSERDAERLSKAAGRR